MMYFKDIQSLEELRKEYKRLVKVNHPDNGGSEDAIKVINVEYELTFKVLTEKLQWMISAISTVQRQLRKR